MSDDRSRIVSAGWSVFASGLAALLVALQALALCWLWWSWQTGVAAAFCLLTGYAVAVALGYRAGGGLCTMLSRQGRRVRTPVRGRGLAVVAAVWVLCGITSGDNLRWVLLMAVVLPLAVLPAAGLSVGFYLAVVAFGRSTGFRGALGAVRRLHRGSRRAEWEDALAHLSMEATR